MKIRFWILAAALIGVFASPATAAAQPAADALPAGGVVVAGSASIGAPSAGGVVIKQSTPRAVIDWTSFDVGPGEAVQIKAPSAASITLLRVVGGDASQIAGDLKSNGTVLLVDGAGAEVFPGSMLAGASVLIGAPGISNQNFVSGKLVFDGAVNPTAAIVNGGSIETSQGGAAVLLGPGIENTGQTTARLGHALMIAGQGATISQLNSADAAVQITTPTAQAPVAADGQTLPALIAQSGTVMAAGGDVQMLVAADPGVSQNAISATGLIAADTVDSTSGTIRLDAAGGGVSVDGRVVATGDARELGGSIELLADSSNTVSIGTQATLDASGDQGGGTIAIGTTTARAKGGPSVPAPESSMVTVAPGVAIAVDATKAGDGGHITALSTTETDFAATASATGGPASGNGGVIEISSAGTVDLVGASLDVSAPQGNPGTILLDPAILIR